MIYCEQPSNTIFAPLDIVIWNHQTPTSSSAKLATDNYSRYDPISGWALASDHPETMIYCEQPSNTILAPLDIVIWNDQTPTSSSAKLATDNYSRYDPISGWALARSTLMLLILSAYLSTERRQYKNTLHYLQGLSNIAQRTEIHLRSENQSLSKETLTRRYFAYAG